MSFSDAALDDLKSRMPCHQVAAKWVKLRKSGAAWVGPCPLCSRDPNKKTATKFKATDQRWMCAACMDGGDVIELVRKVEGKDFASAVEWLGGVQQIDQAEADRRKAERDAKAAEAEKAAAEFRERERGTLFEAWKRARRPINGTTVERYLALRGLEGAPTEALRCIEQMPYYDSGKKNAETLHRGPAMLAAFLRDGKFSALHITWLDLAQPSGKLKLGEQFPAKKMRGSKSGALIKLVEPEVVTRVFIGEGIETTLSVWCALNGQAKLEPGDAFYVAGDLGNLAGRASESVAHPTLKTNLGRSRRVPGPWPADDADGIALPASVERVVLLGDGDSDAFTTRCALARASARLAADGREVVVAMATAGNDYNDIWRASRDAAAVCLLIDAAAPLTPDDVMAAVPARDSAPNSARPESAKRVLNKNGAARGRGRTSSPSDEPPPFDDGDAFPPAAAAAPPPSPTGEPKGEPSQTGEFRSAPRRPGTRSANRARWGGPPHKYGEGDEALNRWLAFFPMTELGLVERYVQRQKHRLKHCEAIGWLLWTGKLWSRVGAKDAAVAAGHEVVRAVQDEAESIRDTEFDEIVEIKPGKKKDDEPVEVWLSDLLESFGRLSETKAKMTLFEHAAPYLSVEVDQLDADPYAINLDNGTLLARRKWTDALPHGWRQVNRYIRLKPHDQNDLITKIMPVKFDAAAECERYDQFLEVVQPSAEVRDFLDEWNGYSLTGDASEQKLVFHYGNGKNGKSTERAVREAMLGDYGKSIPIETFINVGQTRSGSAPTPELAMLRRVRMVATSEPEKGWKLNEALIKALTGGTEMAVRELHKAFFQLKPEFKLTIDGNFKPNIGGGEADSGMWRRMLLILWGVKISKAQQDPHLVDKLKLESSGILNRWLAGLSRWMERGLKLPDEVAQATEEFRIASDPLGRFLSECTKANEDGRVQSTLLFLVYAAWCKASGEREWTPTGFGRAMNERGFAKHKSSTNHWLGFDLIKHVNDFVDHAGNALTPSTDGGEIAPPEAYADDDDVPL